MLLRAGSTAAELADVHAVRHRLAEEAGSLHRILERAEPDIVYHLAARYVAEHSPDDIPGLIASNVTFSTQLYDACARVGCGKLVVAGTSWQHFSAANHAPATLYAATKGAQELIGAYFVDACGLRAAFLHLTDTYGPADPRQKLFSLLRRAAASGQELPMSPGEQILELVYIDDIVAAFIHAGAMVDTLNDGTCAKWSVRAARGHSLKEVVAIWEQTTGMTVPIRWGGRPYRAREVMRPWQETPSLPGWIPQVELEAGIALMEQASVQA